MTADTIQKIADDLEGFILLSDQQRKTLVDRLRALSARASAGEGGGGGEVLPCHAPADCLVSEGPVGYRLQGTLRDNTILALRDAYRSGSNRYYYAVGKAADRLIAANTAAPQPAQAGASGGGEHEKMAAYLTQAIKESEAGKTVYVRLTPSEVEECVTLLRTPASPATGDAATWEEEIRRHEATPPARGDGEGDAFEAWASSQKYDMTTHPLHWLFLNERTYAARQGWRAALEYVAAALALPAQGEGNNG